MDRLPHGYTNPTRRLPEGGIEKRFEGSDRFERANREYACLTRLAARLPIPTVVKREPGSPLLILSEAIGTHGQELIDAVRPTLVLKLLGALLRDLQQISPSVVPELTGTGTVIVHGDFGPQNVLIHHSRVSALFDWEFAHIGQPVEDLAWAEWIVRMHHPTAVDALAELHSSTQLSIEWPERHREMRARCEELMRYGEARGSVEAATVWRDRLRVTERWGE